MDIATATRFLLWCTLIDGALLLFWSAMFMAAPDLVYRSQRRWFDLSRETFHLVFYAFLAAFKLCFIVFNLVPLLALLIIA